jgi:ABC-type transport system involved in cytochrome c biogenesis ATPase subunit
MAQWTLACHRLGKRFGERWVFRGLELELGVGARLIVRGANGSGKSTLLRLIAGLLAPTEGRVELRANGRPVPDRTRMLGWCAADAALYRELTGYEHLHWWAQTRGLPSDRPTLMAHMERFELAHRAHEWYAPTRRACANGCASRWRPTATRRCCCSTNPTRA